MAETHDADLYNGMSEIVNLVDCLFTLNLLPLSELMKSVGSHCSLSQLYMMKVTV